MTLVPPLELNHDRPLPREYHGGTVIIGNFDGVHRGHAGVIAQAANLPRPHIILSFAPHPRAFFAPNHDYFQLSSPAQQCRWLGGLGVDVRVVLKFDSALAGMSADDFVIKVLVENFRIAALVSGDDFHFGKNRGGDGTLLANYAGQGHFRYIQTPPQKDESGKRFSSTAAREAIACGDMHTARQILGRPYQLTGRVIRGEQIGRTLGFPTANMTVPPYLPPALGIYVVTAALGEDAEAQTLSEQSPVGENILSGVASFGVRPVLGERPALFESHFFDFTQDIYGQELTVNLRHCLRFEQNFVSLEAMTAQMRKDADAAKKFLQDDKG